MANIRQFKAPEGLALHPTETGIDAIESAARRGGSFFNQAADAISSVGQRIGSTVRDVGDVALQSITHQQISQGAADGTQLAANLDQQWNNLVKTADPNDPTVRQKFLEQTVEPQLQSYQGAFSTEDSQKFGEQFVDRLRNHLSTKTAADMSTMAGEAIKVNMVKTVNSLGSMVANDPSSLNFALDSVDHAISAKIGSSPTLDAGTAASVRGEVTQRAKENLVKAAVIGMITKNPNTDLDVVQKKYGEYLKPGEIKQFEQAAKTQAKTDQLQQKALEQYQQKEAERAAGAAISKNFTDNVAFDANGNVTIKPGFFNATLDVERKYPGVATNDVRTMLNWGQAQQRKEDNSTDPATKATLLEGTMNPSKPTSEMDVLRAEADGKLSRRDGVILREMVNAAKTGTFSDPVFSGVMGAAKQQIEQSLQGPENYGKFFYAFATEYQRMKQAGTLPANALDVRDDKSLISQYLKQYAPTVQEKVQYHMFKNIGANPASLGENGLNIGGAAPAPPRIETKEQFDKLPAGARYISARDGQTYEKR